jgi:hypothetical protein
MAAGITGISGRTWRRIGVLGAVALTIGVLTTGDPGSSAGPSGGSSSFPTSLGVPSDQAQDPAAELARERQAVQALNDVSQLRYDALMNTASSNP